VKIYGPHGKPINKSAAIAVLQAGKHITVEGTRTNLTVEKNNDDYVCSCKPHCSKCKMKDPARAIEWADEHISRHHS